LSEKLDHRACPTTIGRLLRDQKYGLRSHRKVLHTGKSHVQRDQQFQYIAKQREDFRRTRDPRISVDTKKKELVGQFKNAGQTWCEQAEKVNDHDFPSEAVGRAAPYGVYDPERNEGHVCVTTSSDTADLAVDALCDWWRLSQPHYSQAKRLLIEADSGGSNAARSRRYKKRLQDFADETGLEITVSHYPPGTSKWNPIEHRLFSQIAATWAGHVLSTLRILLGFIRRTTTATGLKVTATYFERTYQTGLKVTNAEFKTIQLTHHDICPQWNYTIRPRPKNTE
jgi:Rhodopirellula transposase DDE domain